MLFYASSRSMLKNHVRIAYNGTLHQTKQSWMFLSCRSCYYFVFAFNIISTFYIFVSSVFHIRLCRHLDIIQAQKILTRQIYFLYRLNNTGFDLFAKLHHVVRLLHMYTVKRQLEASSVLHCNSILLYRKQLIPTTNGIVLLSIILTLPCYFRRV